MLHRLNNMIPVSLLCVFMLSACSGGGSNSAVATGTSNYSVKGSISIERGSAVDADVMGFNGVIAANDTFGKAQLIANPTVLGGYLSGTEGTYQAGQNFYKDTRDYFLVSLIEGQQLRFSVFLADASISTVNLTLTLRPEENPTESAGELIFDRASTQTLTVPQSSLSGKYFIELSASENNSSPVLYTLALSQTLINGSSFKAGSLESEFVPGEILIKFNDELKQAGLVSSTDSSSGSTLSGGTATSSIKTKKPAALKPANARQVITSKHGLVHQRAIGQLADVYSFSLASTSQSIAFETEFTDKKLATRINEKLQTLALIEVLKQDENVVYAEPNYIYRSAAIPPPDDPEYGRQWSLPMLQVPSAWEASTGSGVIVAVIDTGIDPDHLDLQHNIRNDGYDFISDPVSAGDGDGPDADPSDLGSFFHGSHVAGIIAAEANNNEGIAGVAYNATLMPLRVLGVNDTGTNSDIANAVLYAAGLDNSIVDPPDTKADIINLSLGGPDFSKVLNDAIQDALAEGVIIVAAAGNNSSSAAFYPAAFEGVIGVASVTDNKTRSTFSNFGEHIDVAAPGGTGAGDPLLDGFQDGILSTVFASEYAEYAGTSMATPHVAGIAALMKSVMPSLDNTSFLSALQEGRLTDDIGPAGKDSSFGYGLINAVKALNEAAPSNIISDALNVFPQQMGFTGANTTATLSLTNPGAGSVSITGVQSIESWIEITETPVDDPSLLGQYQVKIESSGLAENSVYSGEITIDYQINNDAPETYTVDVFFSNFIEVENTVGTLLVSLYQIDESQDDKPLVRFALVEAQKKEGKYDYRFSNIPNGQYYLRAGTDNDLDFSTFDAGEARGSYPTFSQSEFIEVAGQNLSDLDFGVQFQSLTQSSANKSIGSSDDFR